MEFFLLGTGTLVPHPARGPSGYLLKGRCGAALVDGGSGTLGRLAGIGEDYRQVADLLYTHRHPDHTADLVPFLFARKYAPDPGDGRAVRVWGPAGFGEFVAGLLAAWRGWADPEGRFELECLHAPDDAAPFEVVGIEVRAYPTQHSDPGLAYRFRDPETGGTLCYSGDSDLCPGLERAAEDVDVLVVECSFPDAQEAPGHMTPSKVAALAGAGGARRVILTHLYPVVPPESLALACERALGRPVELGADGMSVRL